MESTAVTPQLLERACSTAGHERAPLSVLVVAAHPDDEVIGAGALLSRVSQPSVLHVTDGAPQQRRFWPPEVTGGREDYARVRRAEVVAALELAGVRPPQIRTLGIGDQEASFLLGAVARRLAAVLAEARVDLVLTHPYEGGHPDHDATAFAVHAAIALSRKRGLAMPALAEMTSYHGRDGERIAGEFLPADTPIVTRILTPEERALKTEMLARFTTQQAVLSGLRVDFERYRPAPRYDFTRPPHEGPLYYETQDAAARAPLGGRGWRRLAGAALRDLDLAEGACV